LSDHLELSEEKHAQNLFYHWSTDVSLSTKTTAFDTTVLKW